jgi:hypothetical protein
MALLRIKINYLGASMGSWPKGGSGPTGGLSPHIYIHNKLLINYELGAVKGTKGKKIQYYNTDTVLYIVKSRTTKLFSLHEHMTIKGATSWQQF